MWTIFDRVRLSCDYLFHYPIIVNSITHFLHSHDGFCQVVILMFRFTLYWILLMLCFKDKNLSALVSPTVQKSIILAPLKKMISKFNQPTLPRYLLSNEQTLEAFVRDHPWHPPSPSGWFYHRSRNLTVNPRYLGSTASVPVPPVTWYGQWLSVAKGPDTSLLQSHTTILLLGQAATRLCQSPHHRFSWSGNTYPGVHGVPPKDVGLDCLELVYQHT